MMVAIFLYAASTIGTIIVAAWRIERRLTILEVHFINHLKEHNHARERRSDP